MKCARQLFPHSEKQAQMWAIYAYERWTRGEGGTPEMQRDRRNPNWKKSLELFEKRRQKTKIIYYRWNFRSKIYQIYITRFRIWFSLKNYASHRRSCIFKRLKEFI